MKELNKMTPSKKEKCCEKCKGEGYMGKPFCINRPSCPCHQPQEKVKKVMDYVGEKYGRAIKRLGQDPQDWREREKEVYEKWRREHPDCYHTEIKTPAEWFVRNYVESRLYPFIDSEIAKAREPLLQELLEETEKREKKNITDIKIGSEEVNLHFKGGLFGYNQALSDIQTLIREKLKI